MVHSVRISGVPTPSAVEKDIHRRLDGYLVYVMGCFIRVLESRVKLR